MTTPKVPASWPPRRVHWHLQQKENCAPAPPPNAPRNIVTQWEKDNFDYVEIPMLSVAEHEAIVASTRDRLKKDPEFLKEIAFELYNDFKIATDKTIKSVKVLLEMAKTTRPENVNKT